MGITRNRVVVMQRLSGSVKRYHTWPTINQQTNADHTFHLLRIYIRIFGAPSPMVTVFIVRHDMGEIASGDLPFHAKANNPDLKVCADRVEQAHLSSIDCELPQLPLQEKLRIKVCDLLEMHEFGLVEAMMGNQFAEPICVDTLKAVLSITRQMCDSDKSLVHKFISKLKDA